MSLDPLGSTFGTAIEHSVKRLTSKTKRDVSTAEFEPRAPRVPEVYQANTLPTISEI